MTQDFSAQRVKEYRFWEIYVHPNQGYLGRCVVWCKRPDALDLADALPEEQSELFSVLHELRAAAKGAFGPDWFNYAFLGNETRHLHGHFIPRYQAERHFMGFSFKDERFGLNYLTDKNFITASELLEAVKGVYRAALNQVA